MGTLAEQRTEYHVDGTLRGVDEPCLYPNNIACEWTPSNAATACPKLTLYSKSVFAGHAHNGSKAVANPTQTVVAVPGPRAEAISPAVEGTKRTNTQNLVCFTMKAFLIGQIP